ncbi:biotin--[acetyl-CoA-carboxylase] ligase [Candidatus Avelusimicrobium sp.]|uniref:biotin--[acetyl-CoA-carboxylase] ligase n=1 Tax=Candidatus Avelusimicrobium sp. TaxID=3048833 RepID=UPI003D7C7698
MAETTFPLQSVTKVIGLERVDSTQALAAELALKGEPEGTLVLACEQTEAFGRDGQPFYSAEGGVYFTLLLRPNKSEEALHGLGEKMAEVIAQTLTSIFEIKAKATAGGDTLAWDKAAHKWKKIAGVLVQTVQTDKNEPVLLGVGIHLNNPLPASRKKTEVSLKQLIRTETSKELFLDELLENFWKEYSYWLASAR